MVEADAFTDFIVVVKRSMCSVMEGIVVVKFRSRLGGFRYHFVRREKSLWRPGTLTGDLERLQLCFATDGVDITPFPL